MDVKNKVCVHKRNIEDIKVGDNATLVRKVTSEDVFTMAELSGDFNPIHIDPEYAKTTRFKRVIAHGLYGASMVSALLGNDLPGLGTIIISENIKFLKPIYVGDTATATVVVDMVDYKTRRIQVSFYCTNQEDERVMEGTAKTLLCD